MRLTDRNSHRQPAWPHGEPQAAPDRRQQSFAPVVRGAFLPSFQAARRPRRALAFSLLEFTVAMGIGSLVLVAVASLSTYATRSSIAIVNYTSLENNSRYGLDILTREVREATKVTGFQSNLSLSLTNQTAVGVTLTYNPTNGTVVMTKTGQSATTLLTGCDRWAFGLYQRTACVTSTNISFYPATNTTGVLDPSLCKLISFSWKCSQSIMAQKVNTESDQSAIVVLRNKQ